MAQDQYFEVSGVTKNFGGLSALRQVNFNIEQGRITSLIGPNGAGKTTLFNVITGVLSPDGGEIYFKGQKITGWPSFKIVSRGVARTFQDLRLFHKLTALQNVLLGFQDRQGERLFQALLGGRALTQEEKQDLTKAQHLLRLVELETKSEERVENLSHGEQKLLSLARVLATDAELLMLDEPTSGLPLGEVDRMLELIQDLAKKGKTIFIVEHNMEAVMGVSNRVIVLNFGELIASGTPQEIQVNQDVIRVYLGI